jgi:hypothetical protein
MAYKVFSNGDALTGGELNTFLMNQSVISFATTTARDAALTAPLEGQLVWLEDSNKYVYYSGSAWVDLIVPASSGNAIINGAFEINQRNFSSTTADFAYGFDRFAHYRVGGSATVSAQTFTPGAAPVAGYESTNHIRLAVTGGSTAGDQTVLFQPIEGVRTFAGQTVTVSFWAKAAAGTPKLGVAFQQIFGTGGSTAVSGIATTFTLTTSWVRYTTTLSIPSITGKTIGANNFLGFNFVLTATSSIDSIYGTSVGVQTATFDIWGVQVEGGSTATPFRRNANSIQGELAACQRYYFRQTINDAYGAFQSTGIGQSTSAATFPIVYPVRMRTVPTVFEYSGLAVHDHANSGYTAMNSVATVSPGTDVSMIYGSGMSGLTGNRPYLLRGNNNINAFIAFGAEL